MNRLLKLIMAFVAITLTAFAIFLPLRLQKIYNKVAALMTYTLKDFKIITRLMTQEHEQKQESAIIEKEGHEVMSKKNEEVCLMFSGGWDSTLAAFKLCETFKKVHLLTYYHSNSAFTENSKVNVNRLKDKFGGEKIIHHLIDIDQLKENLYHGIWRQDRRKYGLFLINCECSACRIAMFAHLIRYSLENNIHYCASGEVKVAPSSLVQGLSDKLDELKRELCNAYGLIYLRPVYYEKNPHKRLFDLGLIDKEVKHIKFPYEYLFHEAQPTCYIGPFSFIFAKFYFLPYQGEKVQKEKKINYFREKMNVAKGWINDCVENSK
jgi:Predicted PP-loop superfamily ATPase